MKRLILLLTVFLFVSFTCQAHKAIGYKPERTMEGIQKTEQYFRDNYNLSLKNDVIVYVTKSYKEYQSVLEKFNVPNAKELTRNSYAVTSGTNGILINGSGLSDRHFLFILAHELVHKYQFENYPNPHADYVLLEGKADIIAEEISKYDIPVSNHNIPYEELKTREGFFKNSKNRPNDTLEQIRYYAKKIPFL